jgi:hypothetical protein
LERERQITEQRRIMNEEYRLLRQTQQPRPVATPAARSVVVQGRPDPTASTRQAELTLWQRLSRLLGAGHAVRS